MGEDGGAVPRCYLSVLSRVGRLHAPNASGRVAGRWFESRDDKGHLVNGVSMVGERPERNLCCHSHGSA